MFTSKMYPLFWFRKSKTSPLKGSIQCRVTIEKSYVEIGSTQISCNRSDWDAENQRFISSPDKDRNNRKLREITTHLDRIYDLLLTQHPHVTPSLIKDHYLGKTRFYHTIDELFIEFLKHRAGMMNGGLISKSTYEVNENYIRHIKDYFAANKVIQANAVQDTAIDGLYFWLLAENRLGERTARKVVAFCKQIWGWAKREKLIPDNPLDGLLIPGKDTDDDIDNTHLSIEQLVRLIQFNFNDLVNSGQITTVTAATLSAERDAFVFNCFTGMHHCDYTDKAFRIEPYKGSYFLKGRRKKSKKLFAVKLLDPAVQILNKYGGLDGLPVKSNQKRNQTLKLIAIYVGIPLTLSTKIARKTFADLALNEMLMNPEDVAACLGLSTTKYLKHYARTHERRLMAIMKSWTDLERAG